MLKLVLTNELVRKFILSQMEKRGYDFVNIGGEEVYTGDAPTNVSAHGEDNWQNIKTLYSKVGTMIYNKESRDCIVRIGE